MLTWIIVHKILPADDQIARQRLTNYRHRGGSGFIQNYTQRIKNCVQHKSSTISWKKATPVIVGQLVGHMW